MNPASSETRVQAAEPQVTVNDYPTTQFNGNGAGPINLRAGGEYRPRGPPDGAGMDGSDGEDDGFNSLAQPLPTTVPGDVGGGRYRSPSGSRSPSRLRRPRRPRRAGQPRFGYGSGSSDYGRGRRPSRSLSYSSDPSDYGRGKRPRRSPSYNSDPNGYGRRRHLRRRRPSRSLSYSSDPSDYGREVRRQGHHRHLSYSSIPSRPATPPRSRSPRQPPPTQPITSPAISSGATLTYNDYNPEYPRHSEVVPRSTEGEPRRPNPISEAVHAFVNNYSPRWILYLHPSRATKSLAALAGPSGPGEQLSGYSADVDKRAKRI